jgi:hypothetical protein
MKPEKIEAKTKKLYEASVMEIVLLHYQKSLLVYNSGTFGFHETDVKTYTA